ncbi:MAG: type VI secretion system baseplate subunit TssK, partial [Polyangiaceae bacterium]
MTTPMTLKPYWPRTMQLRPAHLHAHGSYVEDLLTGRTLRRAPLAYGILELDIDAAAGAQGEVALRRLDAIFPSGAVAQVDAKVPLRR